jgi:hypothetical protein
VNDRERLVKAFAELEEQGYFAPTDWGQTQCCQSCDWYKVPEGAEKVVFWHSQDDERAFGGKWVGDYGYGDDAVEWVSGGDDLVGDLYLAWAGDSSEIAAALRKQGLTVDEPVDDSTRILVKAA